MTKKKKGKDVTNNPVPHNATYSTAYTIYTKSREI